jgi:hypothetical protein
MYGRSVRYPNSAAFDSEDRHAGTSVGQRLGRALAYVLVGVAAYLAVAVTVYHLAVLIRS